MNHLYHFPDVYAPIFHQQEAEELGFYSAVLFRAIPGRVISMGCGEGHLEAGLQAEGLQVVGFDLSRQMASAARARGVRSVVVGRLEAPPLRGAFDGAMSGLLSFAYLTTRQAISNLLSWLREVLVVGAPVALELPVAHRPWRIQGLEERAELTNGGQFRFQYLDEEQREPEFSVLHTLIEVRVSGEVYSRRAPLAVYTPEGIRALLEAHGFRRVRFFAPYDLASETQCPPEDCLRAVVVAERSE